MGISGQSTACQNREKIQKSQSASPRQCIMERYQLWVWREGHATSACWPYFVWRCSSWVVALNAKGSSKTGRLKGICTQITDCGAYCCDMLWLCMLIMLRRRTQQRTPPLPTPLMGHRTAHPIQLKGLPDQWSVMVSCVCVTWVTWVQFRFFDENMWESWEGMEWKGYDRLEEFQQDWRASRCWRVSQSRRWRGGVIPFCLISHLHFHWPRAIFLEWNVPVPDMPKQLRPCWIRLGFEKMSLYHCFSNQS